MTSQLPTVLVIDDDELIVDLTVQTLNKLGFPAVGRVDADGAMEVSKAMPSLRVLLSDVRLRGGTGPDLVRRVLRERPELKVVFMSGGFHNIPFRRTDPVVDKPFDQQSLRRAIHDALNYDYPDFDRRKIPDRRRVSVKARSKMRRKTRSS
jgi:two-component system cell cycle sensor histidine kinase/response regulator CckA